jgi:D-glycero-alpha-D-manno-heptose-7-phosphate kinase
VLKKPIGKQDQYNAAIGGLNHFCFYPNGGVAVRAVRMPFEAIQKLFGHLMLMWTGLTRSAESVLREQQSNIDKRLAELTAMRDAADDAVQLFESPSFRIEEFGRLLDEAWAIKRRLASSISNSMIDDAYACARKHGAYGGKVCGAGAGGFLLLCAPPEKRAAIRRALPSFTELSIGYEPHGARVLFPQTHAGSTQFVPDLLAATAESAF